MRNIVLSTLIASSLIVSSVSAAEMADSAMMQKDTMMKDTMMQKDTMMMKDSMESKMTVSQIAKKHGYNWVRDSKSLAMKAGVANYRGTAMQNAKIKKYLLSMKMDDAMMKDDGMMMKDKDSMMKKDDAMMQKDTMMMKKESGMYKSYSESAVSADLAAGKSVYLFFHASWCPGCRSLDSAINADLASIPAGTMIYKVDYDTMTALRQKHGVTMQHTVVKLNADGSMMKKIAGPKSVADILK